MLATRWAIASQRIRCLAFVLFAYCQQARMGAFGPTRLVASAAPRLVAIRRLNRLGRPEFHSFPRRSPWCLVTAIFGPRSTFAWYSGTWFEYVCFSAWRVFVGFAIASITGITVGILIGWFEKVRDLLDPLVQGLRPIPMTAWLPFATFMFGIREGSAIFLIAMGSFFPIVVSCTHGAEQTPKNLVRAALMLGTPPGRLLTRVVLPSALPSIFNGLRVGLGIAWVLVIVSKLPP